MEKKYQIFISSTYEDLKEERKKVQDTILSMYQFPIGMEMFSAADEEQWEIIQETIDSSDYYVLIIGHRYGSVIETGEHAGISFTEKEFRYAAEQGIPVLVFLIDDSVPVTKDKVEQDADKIKKLEKFKQVVKDGRVVQWWTSTEDLANKVMNSLNKQIARGKRIGWVRADGLNLEETQAELVEMSKKIRKLEEENKELKKKVVVRKPDLVLEINSEEELRIPYIEDNTNFIDIHYMKLSMEDVPDEAKKDITQEMLDKYNKTLPSRDSVEKLKEECRFYKQAHNNPFDIEITVCNVGNMKAKDIYLEIQFPDEIVVFKKNSKIPAPKWPEKGVNPIEEYSIKDDVLLQNDVEVDFNQAHSIIDADLIRNLDSPKRCFYNENNSLSIRMNGLMTRYTWSPREKFFLVPKKKGTFEITCSFMCEEYEESVDQIIQVIVE